MFEARRADQRHWRVPCPLQGSRLPRLKQDGANRTPPPPTRGRSAEALASPSPLPGRWDAAAGCSLPQGEPQGRWDRQEWVAKPRSTPGAVSRPVQPPTKRWQGWIAHSCAQAAFKLARLYSSGARLPP